MTWIGHMCFESMKQRKVRTGLTILGVVIGVVSILSMLAIGIGVKKFLVKQFESYSSVKEIRIYRPTQSKKKERMITDRNLLKINNIEHVKNIYPVLHFDAQIRYEKFIGFISLSGVPQEYIEKQNVWKGKRPKEEGLRPTVLLGKEFSSMLCNGLTGETYEEIYKEDKEQLDFTGKNIEFGFDMEESEDYHQMEVVGMSEGNPFDAYCNINILKKYLKRVYYGQTIPNQPVNENGMNNQEWVYGYAVIEVDDIENVDEVIEKLKDMGYQTENEKELLESMQKQLKIIQLILGGIGMITLIVSIIGIVNTMTTSVYDRIYDIGVLKVIGCDGQDLLALFFLEAATIGGIGGIIGVLISYFVVNIGINQFAITLLQLPKGTILAQIPWWLGVLSIFVSTLIGILAGIFPAKLANKIKPILAIGK